LAQVEYGDPGGIESGSAARRSDAAGRETVVMRRKWRCRIGGTEDAIETAFSAEKNMLRNRSVGRRRLRIQPDSFGRAPPKRRQESRRREAADSRDVEAESLGR
jgi:hypothetical protein